MKIAAAVVAALLLAGVAGCSTAADEPRAAAPTPPAYTPVPTTNPYPFDPYDPDLYDTTVDTSWKVPKGYEEWEDGLAYKFVPTAKVQCPDYTSCYQMLVASRDGCDYLYGEVALLTSGRVRDGFTNDSGSVEAGGKARLTMTVFGDTSRRGELVELSCN